MSDQLKNGCFPLFRLRRRPDKRESQRLGEDEKEDEDAVRKPLGLKDSCTFFIMFET